MKWIIVFMIAVATACASCKKSTSVFALSGYISGRWQIIRDSAGKGVGFFNHIAVYKGQTGDSYNFGSDGIVTIFEDDSVYTYNYTVTSGSSLSLYYPAEQPYTSQLTYTVDGMINNKLTLTREWQITPGGIIGQTVYLKR